MKNKNLKEIMEIDIDNIKQKQYNALLKHTKDILNKVIKYLDNKEFHVIEEMLCSSPAGDGYGSDNYFIDFDYTDTQNGMDLGEIIEVLQELDK